MRKAEVRGGSAGPNCLKTTGMLQWCDSLQQKKKKDPVFLRNPT